MFFFQARKRYPEYQYGDAHYQYALVDPNMGLILADKWLATFQVSLYPFRSQSIRAILLTSVATPHGYPYPRR